MTPFSLFSEPFARTGNIAGEGFRRLLGRPALGLMQTVIREAIQNSLDAAKRGLGPDVLLRCRLLEGEAFLTLRDTIFPAHPAATGDMRGLGEAISGPSLRVFEIADFNTSGLGGPTRADAPVGGDEALDFVNFLRNVGAGRDTSLGGGTYGYGKTSLYTLSSCSTILVDSQTFVNGMPVRRMMACQLGGAFDADTPDGRRRFTGRHWWGVPDGHDGVDPLEGEGARELADTLGLPSRDPSRPGTTIMIIDPSLDDVSELGLDLVETTLWNFWPRMVRSTPDDRKLRLRIEIDGSELDVPDPEDFPPLDLFARALDAVRSGKEVKAVASQRPIKHLGNLAIRKGMRGDRKVQALRENSIIPRNASHIALMRPVELVVKYLKGTPYSDPGFEWAGVFICSSEEEVERAFADSEPPAHDDWMPAMLPKGPTKTWVNVALTRLEEEANTFANPLILTGGKTSERGPSLASTATLMGRLLDSSSGKGPGRAGKGSSSGVRKRAAVSQPRFSRLELVDGVRTAIFEADLSNDGSQQDLTLSAEAFLVMDGSAAQETDGLFGFDGKISRFAVDGEVLEGSRVKVGKRKGLVTCHVALPDDVAVTVKLSIAPGEPS